MPWRCIVLTAELSRNAEVSLCESFEICLCGVTRVSCIIAYAYPAYPSISTLCYQTLHPMKSAQLFKYKLVHLPYAVLGPDSIFVSCNWLPLRQRRF